jgi:hypothetical protein
VPIFKDIVKKRNNCQTGIAQAHELIRGRDLTRRSTQVPAGHICPVSGGRVTGYRATRMRTRRKPLPLFSTLTTSILPIWLVEATWVPPSAC